MKKKPDQPADDVELRHRAEERLGEQWKSQKSDVGDPGTAEDTARLVHELQVHQIELEMQNEELQQSHAQVETLLAQYTDLYDLAPAGYLTFDREGAIRQVNLTGARLFGVERSRLVNRRFGLFVAERDQRAFSDFLQKVFASQAKECCEVTLPKESSQPVVVQIEGTCSADGQECRAVVVDLTERKRAEEELRWETALLQAQMDSSPDGILVVDKQGKQILQNQRLNELWKIPPHLAGGKDDAAQVQFAASRTKNPGEFAGKVAHLYSHPDEVSRDEIDLIDGTVLDRYSSPVRDKAGKYFGRIWTFRNITERKHQEGELIKKSTELERFTYTVSHDLKSPLVTIKTFLGYLEQDMAGPDKERVKQDVTFMHTAADKMDRLLDELLNLVRVGRKMNPPVRVTFQEVAREAVGLVAGRIITSDAVVQVAEANVALEGDRSRLVEVWQNLVENACKFMGDQPKPRVEIGVEHRGAETVFFVRDNGMGIDPRHQAKMFNLFEKLDLKSEGTGMGLALVKRVVELYQGRIWVESGGPGRGASFLFTLPAVVAAGILPAVSGGILPPDAPPHGETRCA
jgi:PAS domain S-box-containing protein